MRVCIRSDESVTISPHFADSIGADIRAAVGHRFGSRIDGVDVDITAGAALADGIHCSLKVYPTRSAPVTADECGADAGAAVEGAVEKVAEELERRYYPVGAAACASVG